MRFKHLDLNLLYALDILLEEGSVTAAGKRLQVSQSTMSGILKRLREYFNDDLLVRDGQHMLVTPKAMELRDSVRDIILNIQATIAAQQNFDPATSKRHIRIISSDYAVTVLFREVCVKIKALAPGITFEFLAPSESTNHLFNRGDLDFMLVPDHYLLEGHPNQLLFEEEYVCAIWEKNKLVKRNLGIEQYLEMGHITVGFGANQVFSFEEWFMKHHQVSRRLEFITNDFNTLPQLVIGTDLIATMHKRLAEYYAKLLPIKILQPPMELPRLQEHLSWHKSKDNDLLHNWVKAQIQMGANQRFGSSLPPAQTLK